MLRSIELLSGTVIVSDPCYSLGTWCQGVLNNVKAGIWAPKIEIVKMPGWGNRVSYLAATHMDYLKASDLVETVKCKFEVGVDSGMAGIFDVRTYRNDFLIKNEVRVYDFKRFGYYWLRACGDLALSEDHAGTLPGGVVSSSGYGDGSYTCFVKYEPQEDADKRYPMEGDTVQFEGYEIKVNPPPREIVSIKIEFISDEEIKGEADVTNTI